MTDRVPEDRRIRELLAALHREEPAPPFHKLWQLPPRRPRTAMRWAMAAALLASAGLVATLLYLGGFQSDRAVPLASDELALASSLSDWHGPLDFLLETPGREYLTALPALDAELPSPLLPELEREETLQ